MIRFRRYGMFMDEIWFDAPSPVAGCDLVIVRQALRPPEPSGLAEEFHTLHIDLSRDEESLLAEMEKGTRYEVRRAEEKDSLSVEHIDEPDDEDIRKFHAFFSEFAASKNLSSLPITVLRAYSNDGCFKLARVLAGGDTLVWHSYIEKSGIARLLHSASLHRDMGSPADRAMIGRANRYLHWRDLLHFKQSGCAIYDFGGYYIGSDPAMISIRKFKAGFGGKVITCYNYMLPLSIKGRFFQALKRFKKAHTRRRGNDVRK